MTIAVNDRWVYSTLPGWRMYQVQTGQIWPRDLRQYRWELERDTPSGPKTVRIFTDRGAALDYMQRRFDLELSTHLALRKGDR
jgi:hypothetical protein